MIIDRIKVHQYLTTELGLDKPVADGIVEAVSAAEANVATSDDTERLSGNIERLREDMDEEFRRLREDMDEMEERITRKLVVHVYGAVAIGVSILAGLLTIFEFVV